MGVNQILFSTVSSTSMLRDLSNLHVSASSVTFSEVGDIRSSDYTVCYANMCVLISVDPEVQDASVRELSRNSSAPPCNCRNGTGTASRPYVCADASLGCLRPPTRTRSTCTCRASRQCAYACGRPDGPGVVPRRHSLHTCTAFHQCVSFRASPACSCVP